MKPLRAFSSYDLIVLWAAGLALAVGLFVGFAHVEWSLLRPGIATMARDKALASAHDRQAAEIQQAYASAHPGDSAARTEARRLAAVAEQSAAADSAMRILAARGRVDTTRNAGGPSERPASVQLLLLVLGLAMLIASLAVPIVLVVMTVSWAMSRRAARHENQPT